MKTIRVFAVALCAVLAVAVAADARGANLSGQYAGSVSDSVLGSGNATADMVASDASLGGHFVFALGGGTYDNPMLSGNTRNGLRGEFEATVASVACRFSFKARFDRARSKLDGSYEAVGSACSGENGTFELKQQCYYNVSGDIRPAGGPMHC
jgi:opacity protein-like surface antigen